MDALTILLCVLLTTTGFQGFSKATTIWSLTTDFYDTTLDPSAEPCGDYMTDLMGEFSSPQYPNNYPNNARCTWTIHSTGQTTVLLTFTFVDLEKCCDYIKVFDGPTSLYPLLGELRENRRQSFNSTQNDVTVVFYSDGSVTKKGFRADWVFVDSKSCRNYCGYSYTTCSCDDNCQYNRNCCHDYKNYCVKTTDWPDFETTTVAGPTTSSDGSSCRDSCGSFVGTCACYSACQALGNCCPDFKTYCSLTTYEPDSTNGDVIYSCEYDCGYDFGICSCESSCQYHGTCCFDFEWYCPVSPTTTTTMTTGSTELSTTTITTMTTGTTEHIYVDYFCEFSCDIDFGPCSCKSSCQYLGNCCPDYEWYCPVSTTMPPTTMTTGSTEHIHADYSCWDNCGIDFGTCSCESSCQYHLICCFDYEWYCPVSTTISTTMTTEIYSCWDNCGIDFGTCSCESSCQYHVNCCPDFEWYCPVSTTTTTTMTTVVDYSCWDNCGIDFGTCSCESSCQYNGNCCIDYEWFCPVSTTMSPTTTEHILMDYFCEYSCDIDYGPCSCKSSCQYLGNCCIDYEWYCPLSTTFSTAMTTEMIYSCWDNCGIDFGTCSCKSSCQYHSNCCPDYEWYCPVSTTTSSTMTPEMIYSCWYSCGIDFGTCSCNNSCYFHGNCCPDFEWYCPAPTTSWPSITDNHPACGGHLYGSGMFSSPNYPHYYYDNAYCVWYLSAQAGQRISLSFADVQLERCCNCDYISVHDGSSTGHQQLGKICFNANTNQTFHSSSRYLTVVFRSDYSGVSHGFKAQFTSSLTADQGRVDCSSDNMVIVIRTSYLNSLGFNGNDLYVDDHRCRPTINSTEVVFLFSLNTCGTGKEMMNGYVTYTNNVRASQAQTGEITLQPQFLLHVGCRMEPDTVVQILYKAKEDINANLTGAGRFNASIAFYTSSSFNQQIFHSPYEVNLNQYMYVQVWLNRPDTSLDLFLETCVASPDPNDFKTRSYDLLRNGCPRDSSYYSYINGQQYYARFRFQAFKFLRTHANVYLQCKVIICPENDYNSRCRQGCRLRRKRTLESNHHSNTVILGPITLKEKPGVKKSERRKK
nr:uncharacterized protein LOC129417036 isoform X2 [Misgurnus anguillicaudatus]